MKKLEFVSQADPDAEPIEITLSGRFRRKVPVQPGVKLTAAQKKAAAAEEAANGEMWRETFYVLSDPPGGIIDQFLTAASTAGTTTMWSSISLVGFLTEIMIDDINKERFRELMVDPTRLTHARDLLAIVNRLIPEYTRFPTGAPGA